MALAALLLAACGSGGVQGTKVTLTEYRFDPSDIPLHAGAVVLTLENVGATSHDMVVADSSGAQFRNLATRMQHGCRMGALHPVCYPEEVKTIQIRNVPETVHRVLTTRAAASGLSLSDYALSELERVANHPPVAQLLGQAQARAGGTSAKAVVAAVRSGRDRR